MNRIAPPRVALVLVACAAIAACSGGSGSTRDAGAVDGAREAAAIDGARDAGAVDGARDAVAVDGEITSCPPAPLEGEFEGRPCHDPQLGCPYASPNGFQYKWPNICDVEAMGQCWKGTFGVLANTVNCCPEGPGDVTWCGPITEGAPCNEPDNSECVLPDQSATCACDKPGPVWRCAPIDGGVHYCSCFDMTDCTDAGADGGLDGGAG